MQSGKWHAGASCEANLPVNRGFNRSIGYLSGAEDHYTQMVGGNVDLWQDDAPAYVMTMRSSYSRHDATEVGVGVILCSLACRHVRRTGVQRSLLLRNPQQPERA